MTGWEFGLTALNVVQMIALAWISAWQQRAAKEVRKLNGALPETVHEAVASALVRQVRG